MAVTANPCWMLALCACLTLTVRADCEKECELCFLHLNGRQTDISLATCVQACEGVVATATSLDLCQDVLTEVDPGRGAEVPQEQITKRYGGFMKKSAEVAMETAEKRYGGFLRRDGEGTGATLQDLLLRAAASGRGGGVTRGAGLGGGARPLSKRYGGFMRRVGSPSWEESKKVYEGLLKRSWGAEGGAGSPPHADKRYGGFMD